MSKNISVWLIIPRTNLHVGNESVVNFSVIDKAIQRDVTTGLPCINSSSLKGAVKEYLDQVSDMGKDKIIQLFGSVKGNNDTTQKGSAIFFDVNLLAIPVPTHNERGYSLAYSDGVISSFVEKANVLGAESITAEGIKQKIGVNLLKRDDFDDLCSDDSLPIIARNCLDNGESINLWYEQVLPSHSVLGTIIVTPRGDELDLLNGKIVQIGANATIGYGYCKFVKL